MELTEDTFRALARSGPWRWATVHLRRRAAGSPDVEAWIRRPDWMLVREKGCDDSVVRGGGRTAVRLTASTQGTGSSSETVTMPWGGSLTPLYRPDGLLAARPDGRGIDFDDPMWEDYRWVAMLDPVELSADVELSELRAGARAGRDTWWARAAPVAGYDPRCSCCPLLWSQVSDDLEYGECRARYSTDYPAAYEVALDVQTAMVVELRPLGAGRDDLAFDVDILQVDADLSALAAEHM